MCRQERKNMIDFIQKVEKFEGEQLIYMTDADIEYLYNRIYFHHVHVE